MSDDRFLSNIRKGKVFAAGQGHRLLGAILVVAVVAACGGTGEQPGGDASPSAEGGGQAGSAVGDPCALLTSEQITRATGYGVVSSQRTEPSAGDSAIDDCD